MKKQEEEIRESYIECYREGNVHDIVYKGYMKKVAEAYKNGTTYKFYQGYSTNDTFEDCATLCVKKKDDDDTVERTTYYIFEKSRMLNATYVKVHRDIRNGSTSQGYWGDADFYGIDNKLYFDDHGETYSYDTLVREEKITQANEEFATLEAKFDRIMSDSSKSYKYQQFVSYINNKIGLNLGANI